MKKTFTKDYIIAHKGCYNIDQVEKIPCINNKKITLKQLFRDLPIKHFTWFLVNKCYLILNEKRTFVLHCSKQALPIYEKKYPKDKRVRELIEATELYLNGKISIEDLGVKRNAINSSSAVDIVEAAIVNAYSAVNAADVDTDAYKKSIWEFIKLNLI